jgi:hypothetical protein
VRRFDANFNLIGAQSIDLGSNQTTEPSISFFADGSYVIVYTVGTGANADIVARIVSPTGIVGSQFDAQCQRPGRGRCAAERQLRRRHPG